MDKPIKSRHGLTRCGACRAHIRAAERPSLTDCPFCGANLLRGGPVVSAPVSRGGIVAASLLAFSLSACGGGEAADPDTTADDTQQADTGGDEPADEPDDYADDPADDPSAVSEYGVAPDAYEEEPADDMRPTARYGMPPQR